MLHLELDSSQIELSYYINNTKVRKNRVGHKHGNNRWPKMRPLYPTWVLIPVFIA